MKETTTTDLIDNMSNIELLTLVKVVQRYDGLTYNSFTERFTYNGKELPQYKIRRFIVSVSDDEINSTFIARVMQRLRLRCNELSRHN